MKIYYAHDHEAVAKIADDQRADFEKWFDQLDAEHAARGASYGQGSLAELTGIECWIVSFQEEMTPAEALAEDLSYAD